MSAVIEDQEEGPAEPTELPPVMTPKEVADMLRVTEACLAGWRCLKPDHLPFSKIGSKTVRYLREDVTAFIAKNMRGLPVKAKDAK